MNPLIRIADKLVRLKGYQVRKDNGLGLGGMRVLHRALAEAPAGAAVEGLEARPAGGAAVAGGDTLNVCLRTCLRENRNVNPKPRLTGSSLEELTLRCARSLVRSLNDAAAYGGGTVTLRVLDDRSDPAPLRRLKQVLEPAEVPVEVVTTTTPGQGPSLLQQFDWARGLDGLVYFVEDDWLHEDTGVRAMWDFYRDTAARIGGPLVIAPQEHGSLYTDHPPSYLVLGRDRRWRTIHNATHTLFTHAHVVRDHWDCFENTRFIATKKRKLGSERATTNRLFEIMPAFSPMSPAAVHLQYDEILPPFFDWKPLWDRNDVGDVLEGTATA
ncbi:hypothetical protein C882_3197 [Caenispirillum salinarum AK4]|uniref:Glycosyltransferase n=1 Tax=Caenispirillum salinarum AK4 TaxID=1238182 RepID=K9HPE8_9PROT|nr:hypothetical protein [Caenispirillum salinarum]EKV32133.1 hypothetical protein C882_3197 [Caenispirillum salinarum AK4]